MRAAVYYSNSDIRIEERPVPEPGPGEILMRVRASGICGSDLMEWYRKPKAPLVLGHEVAGTVERVGPGVDGFAPGARIVTTHHVPCNRCRFCLTDRHAVCPTLHATTFDPGGFSEYVRLPRVNVERGTFELPESVGFDEASFVEPLACAIRGQRLILMGLRAGDSVAVLGAGVSGILHVQLARALGAGPIVATDTSRPRLAAALRFGADAALPAGESDLPAAVARAMGGRRPDRVIVCAASRAAMEQALALVESGGSVLFFAPLPPGERLELDALDLWKRGVTITHSYAGPPAEMLAALDLIAARRVDVRSMITHRLPLEEIAAGYRLMLEAGESLKILVEP